MIQNTLHMECKARGQDEVFVHTTYKTGSSILQYYEINTLCERGSMPRQGAYFTLLWIGNGDRESQTLNLSPIINFNRKVFIWKTCVISSHTTLHFIYVLTFSEISKIVCSIGRRYLSIDWNVNKYIFKSLDDSIDSRFTIDWSKGILDQSKNWRNSPWSFWMTRSILDSYSIDWKEHSINLVN